MRHKSRVYTDRPTYADFDSPRKFETIKSIIAKRLTEYPKAICSYSGGSDSDIILHLIETVRDFFQLPPVHYVFFNTGLEMAATRRHVRAMEKLYGITIADVRPKKNIVQSVREHGQPFMSKIFSRGLQGIQRKNIPLSVADEYASAENKKTKQAELYARHPRSTCEINFLCGCRKSGEIVKTNQLTIHSEKYLLDFIKENPPPFKISRKCCDYCKKQPARKAEKPFDMIITGERKSEGGPRATLSKNNPACFTEMANGKFRLKPLFYVSDADKQWYKEYHGIRYSDAYEVYGLTRTGCGGCPISYRAVDDLEKIRPFEPNLVKAAWNIFGDSYRYRQQYNDYKSARRGGNGREQGQLWLGESDERV